MSSEPSPNAPSRGRFLAQALLVALQAVVVYWTAQRGALFFYQGF